MINVILDTESSIELDIRTLPGQVADDGRPRPCSDLRAGRPVRERESVLAAHDDLVDGVTDIDADATARAPDGAGLPGHRPRWCLPTVGATNASVPPAGRADTAEGAVQPAPVLEDYGVMFHGDDEAGRRRRAASSTVERLSAELLAEQCRWRCAVHQRARDFGGVVVVAVRGARAAYERSLGIRGPTRSVNAVQLEHAARLGSSSSSAASSTSRLLWYR